MTEQEQREFNVLASYSRAIKDAHERMQGTIDHQEWVSCKNAIDFTHTQLDRWLIRNQDLIWRIGRSGS